MEFNCRCSQRESEKHPTFQTDESVRGQSSTNPASSVGSYVCPSTSETTKVGKDRGSFESSQQGGPIQFNLVEELRFGTPGNGCLYTTVTQHNSCASYPPHWHHPLSVAISLWRTQHGESGQNQTMNSEKASKSRTCQSSNIDYTCGLKSILPEPLPLRCLSPHMHR